jgi:ubiquitin-protein ligase
MRESPRVRRLRSDHKALTTLADESSIFSFRTHGDPPDLYIVRFAGRGLWKPEGVSEVQQQNLHEVHIRLGAAYPRMMPELAWKTPIFHPNISAGGVVCLGGYGTYWVPSLTLDELCVMLWDMIRFENYDEKSPYNREAAAWVKNQVFYRLPLDQRPLRDKKAGYQSPVAAEVVDDDLPRLAPDLPPGRWPGGPSPVTPRPPAAAPPVRRPPPPAPAPLSPVEEGDLIFLDDAPSRPAAAPAQSREEGGIVFIE